MSKTAQKTYECGFDAATIEAPKFFELLSLNGLQWTNRKTENGAFVWGCKDGYIVTENCPLTGSHRRISAITKNYAGSVGVTGTKAFRDRVAKFLKRNAKSHGYAPSTRLFV